MPRGLLLSLVFATAALRPLAAEETRDRPGAEREVERAPRRKAGRARISPSILAADFGRLGDEVRAVTKAGADEIHVDIMDGHFVPNLTFGPGTVTALSRATLAKLQLHLMIDNPDAFLEPFARAGADALWVHAEATPDLARTVRRIHELGLEAGVALRPETPIDAVREVLPELDTVLLLTVNPGFGGQAFLPEVLPKIRQLRLLADEQGLKLTIAVDGGINPDTIGEAAAAGADEFVAGSAVFGRPSYRAALRELGKRAEQGRAAAGRSRRAASR
jgi:ribulose-phosphate 3-epimerase